MVVIMYLRPEVHSRHRQMFKMHCVKSVLIRSILVRIFPEFSDIRTEYGEIEYLSVFNSNVGKCEKNADQNNSE